MPVESEELQLKFKIKAEVKYYSLLDNTDLIEQQTLPTTFIFEDIICSKDKIPNIICDKIIQQVGYAPAVFNVVILDVSAIETESTNI